MRELIRADTGVRPHEVERGPAAHRVPGTRRAAQYSLAGILRLWELAAVPMGVLGWVVCPRLVPTAEADPLRAGATRLALFASGLAWQFILSLIIVRREEGNRRWPTVKRRLRLTAPREPATSEPRPRLWLWVVPFLVAVALVELVLSPPLEHAWVSVFPFFAEPQAGSFAAIFQSPEIVARLEGTWWFLALFVIQAAFNTILGEELFFRGVLLPKMDAVFGRRAWPAGRAGRGSPTGRR